MSVENQKNMQGTPKEAGGTEAPSQPEKAAEYALNELEEVTGRISNLVYKLSTEEIMHPDHVTYSESEFLKQLKQIDSALDSFNSAHLKDALLSGARNKTATAQQITIGALSRCGKLFDFEMQRARLDRARDSQFASVASKASHTFGRALTTLTPAVREIMTDPAFLEHLKALFGGPYEYLAESFINVTAFFLDEPASRNAFRIVNETGILLEKKHGRPGKGIVGLVAEFGTEEQKQRLEDMYVATMLKTTPLADPVAEALPSGCLNGVIHKAASPIAERAFARVKQRFADRYGFELRTITKKQRIEFNQWPLVIRGIIELEEKRKGAAKMLSDKYGIHMFFRYSSQMLLRQLDEETEQKPYGIFIGSYDDFNLALAEDKERLAKISEILERGGMGLKILESGSGTDVMRHLIRLNEQYGENHKIEFMIVAAHGNPTGFLLSDYTNSREGRITVDSLEGKGVRRLKEFFVDQPEIILLSCSTGAKGGIGEKLFAQFNTHVIAPKEPTSLERIEVVLHENRKPHFQVKFRGGKRVAQEFGTGSGT